GRTSIDDIEQITGGLNEGSLDLDMRVYRPRGQTNLGSVGTGIPFEQFPRALRLRLLVDGDRVVGHRHLVPGVVRLRSIGLRARIRGEMRAVGVADECEFVEVSMASAVRPELHRDRVV